MVGAKSLTVFIRGVRTRVVEKVNIKVIPHDNRSTVGGGGRV